MRGCTRRAATWCWSRAASTSPRSALEGCGCGRPRKTSPFPYRRSAGPDELELTAEDVLVLATKTQQAHGALITWADVAVGDGTAGSRLPI